VAAAALERLASSERALNPAGVFAPLGEALSWLIALDDLLSHSDPEYGPTRDNNRQEATCSGCDMPATL
jgi:hypothetical protein